MDHVFISYSRQDTDCALKVVQRMEARGFKVWMDVASIPGGDAWQEAIRKGISNMGVSVVFWSVHSSQSIYVDQEIRLVLNKIFGSSLKIIPLLLDDTPLPDHLRNANAIRFQDCSNTQIEQLIEALPEAIRRPKFEYIPEQTLAEHKSQRPVSGLALLSVPLLESSHCRAFIVGSPDTKPSQPEVLQLCLQFYQAKNDDFIATVYAATQRFDPPTSFLALHITGPAKGDQYRLDDKKSAHWLDAVGTTVEALERVARKGKTKLQVFCLAPSVLTFAIGTQLYRFWPFELYNFAPPGDYHHVMSSSDL